MALIILAIIAGIFLITYHKAEADVTETATKVGVIMNGSKTDRSWNQAHYEGLEKTANDLIYVGHPIDFDEDVFLADMDRLRKAAYSNDEDNIRSLVMSMAPTYRPDGKGETPEGETPCEEAALVGAGV